MTNSNTPKLQLSQIVISVLPNGQIHQVSNLPGNLTLAMKIMADATFSVAKHFVKLASENKTDANGVLKVAPIVLAKSFNPPPNKN